MSEITFAYPFRLNSLVSEIVAGTYQLVVDEELIEGLSFAAYKRVGTHLEIPSLSNPGMVRQLLQVTVAEIENALALDIKRQSLPE